MVVDSEHEKENANTFLRWEPAARIVHVRYRPGAKLGASDGDFLADTLAAWANDGAPFAVLADAKDLGGTDGPYRARVSAFFKREKARGYIALVNVGPIIHVVVEMFRIGTGIQLKTFGSDADARTWLRAKGIPA